DAFTAEEKARDFEYYEPMTVRDSSLSACTQGVLAAEVGHLELAYDYLGEAALMDLHDLEHNVSDGVHMASLAGVWIGSVCGLGGMRDHNGVLSFAPRLPHAIDRLVFRLTFRGSLLKVEVFGDRAVYTLVSGPPLTTSHHGHPLTVAKSSPVTLGIPAPPSRPQPEQPPGRAPASRVRP
ncbi:MAG TPA: glycosyl hydrolase family 65 protein, partial [Actinomycetota bacterium]|nr:glycosyl hydrolase family 65 protein [Actinomycetota bacterium]